MAHKHKYQDKPRFKICEAYESKFKNHFAENLTRMVFHLTKKINSYSK